MVPMKTRNIASLLLNRVLHEKASRMLQTPYMVKAKKKNTNASDVLKNVRAASITTAMIDMMRVITK